MAHVKKTQLKETKTKKEEKDKEKDEADEDEATLRQQITPESLRHNALEIQPTQDDWHERRWGDQAASAKAAKTASTSKKNLEARELPRRRSTYTR